MEKNATRIIIFLMWVENKNTCHDPLPVEIIAAAVGYLVSKLAEDKAEVNSIKLT